MFYFKQPIYLFKTHNRAENYFRIAKCNYSFTENVYFRALSCKILWKISIKPVVLVWFRLKSSY